MCASQPVPPTGVTLDPNAPLMPADTPRCTSHVCVWLTHYLPGDGHISPISDVSALPRPGIPIYIDESVTLDELTFTARCLDGFKHTNSMHVRNATYHPGSFQHFLILDSHRTVGSLAATHSPDEGTRTVVVACRDARTHQASLTKELAKAFGLDYEKQYPFVVDVDGCHFMGAHHYLMLQCPELEATDTWLRVEHQKTYARGIPRQINSYKITPHRRRVAKPASERPCAAPLARVTTSLKNLDATLAHVVEKYPKYSLKNINCQFVCAKSAELLGIQETLRPQWFDHLQRLLGRSEAAIRRRHETARADQPSPPHGLRCRVKKVGTHVRRWISKKLSRRSFDSVMSPS